MERELKSNEKPLQITLDCSSKGIASPKFVFKTSLTVQAPSTESHKTDGFTSYVGALAVHSSSESCNSSRRHSRIIDGEPDRTSMNSYGSAASLVSSKSKSTSSLNLKPKKPLSHTWSNQETSTKSSSPSQRRHTHAPQGTASPINRKLTRPKSVMSNFFTRSLRVRKKSKLAASPRPAPTDTHRSSDAARHLDNGEDNTDNVVPTLVSPLPMERRFTMSAVMHIYFTEARQTQVYKSVLVSEKATTQEVIAQALERYNMKYRDPKDFVLCEVIGKWQDVTSTLPAIASFHINHPSGVSGATTSLPGLGLQSVSPAVNRRTCTSIEEFVECYTRELSPKEHPYSAQFFLTTQEGFTRRFELRSRIQHESTRFLHGKASTTSGAALVTSNRALRHQAMSFDDTDGGIFGQTAHRRRARRNHLAQHSADAVDDLSVALTTTILSPMDSSASLDKRFQSEESTQGGDEQRMFRVESSDKQEDSELRILDRDEVEEISITVNPHHPPDFATLTCFSPDSGVVFQKSSVQVSSSSAQSSISSERLEQKKASSIHGSIYKAKLNTPFLLSLRLFSPETEYLVHKLGNDRTIITSSGGSKHGADDPNISEISLESSIVLCHPKLANYKDPICCICRNPIKANDNISLEECPQEFTISKFSNSVPLRLNGQVMSSDTALLKHGDLLSIGDAYLFMFQDYSSVGGEYIPNYNWKPLSSPAEVGASLQAAAIKMLPHPRISEQSNSTTRDDDQHISSQSVENMTRQHWHHQKEASLSSESEVSVVIEDADSKVTSMIDTKQIHDKSKSLSLPRIESLDGSAKKSETNPTVTHSNSAHQLAQDLVFKTGADLAIQQPLSVGNGDRHLESGEVFRPSPTSSPPDRSTPRAMVHKTKVKQVYAIPKDRKLVFSFMPSEEDLLLDHVIMKSTTVKSACKLAPSYILAMCIEYSSMCNGPQSTLRFIQKATDRIQEVVWVG